MSNTNERGRKNPTDDALWDIIKTCLVDKFRTAATTAVSRLGIVKAELPTRALQYSSLLSCSWLLFFLTNDHSNNNNNKRTAVIETGRQRPLVGFCARISTGNVDWLVSWTQQCLLQTPRRSLSFF
ncbi:hypothetical protein T10_6490 [Trichinella papuae]|uniref:Uncharacterized protein n=1 Tax=Trichinella papuae TaxID=268474 RepID=A0A0V1MY39_9BILA|nr:hypothetical protein T10_6490 [Trichinella papuae]